MKLRLHTLILIGMIAGAAAGWTLHEMHSPDAADAAPGWHQTALWCLDLLGPTLFMGGLKMIFAPLVFASIIVGVSSLPSSRELGAIGWKVLLFYTCSTVIASSIGITIALVAQPGRGPSVQALRAEHERTQDALREEYRQIEQKEPLAADGNPAPEYVVWLHDRKGDGGDGDAQQYEALAAGRARTMGDIIRNDLFGKFLTNPFASLAGETPNALGIIFFAILVGVACTVLGARAEHVVGFFRGFNEVIMTITHWFMATAPVAIFCIVALLIAKTGTAAFIPLASFCAVVIAGIMLHWVVLLTAAAALGRTGPIRMVRGVGEALLVAFTTRSSAATLPVTIANVTEKLGVSPKIAGFSLPLGATVNMDGTALYQTVVVIFLVQLFGGMDDVHIPLNAANLLMIVVTTALASAGAAAIPSGGLVTLAIVASAINLPLSYIVIIFAVDQALDTFRTFTNVLGDSVGAVVVNRMERGRLGEPAAEAAA